MAEGRDDSSSSSSCHLTPLEEQYIREAEEEEAGMEAQIQREKDMASQKLWYAFQDSATAVAHLFRDCQQQAGLAAWVPFHDSASAVTQLYKGSLDVCRQCMECGVKHGHRKRTRDIVTWLKKKRRVIRREELLAFLLDKPYPPDSLHFASTSERLEDLAEQQHHSHQPMHPHPHPSRPLLMSSGELSFSAPVPVSIPMSASVPCFSGPLASPRGRWALIGRDEQATCIQNDGELYTMRENGRKRLNSSSATAGTFEFSQDSPPLAKRMKI